MSRNNSYLNEFVARCQVAFIKMSAPSHIFFGAAAPEAASTKRTKMEASSSSGSSSSDDERLALTEESRAALLRQNELVTDMKLQMRFRTIAAPTLDNDVRMKLR
jgi:hypothetical protein